MLYALALGSNRRHGRHGAPAAVLAAATRALAGRNVEIVARSPVIATAPVGPPGRAFANAALIVRTPLTPPELLALLKRIERDFGRRRGRRWGTRVLDLDILLWREGMWTGRALHIPHPALPSRRFVLDPLVTIAPGWRLRDGRSVRQQHARLTRPRPAHRDRRTVGP